MDPEEPEDAPLPSLRDQEAEDALASDADLAPLETLLGGRLARGLRKLAGHVERSKARRKPLVMIIPGVMGCRLGIPGRIKDDMIWLDPLDVRRGNLDMLALSDEGDPRCGVLGVLQAAYLPAKIYLQSRGFRVRLYPYDWRQDLEGLGRQLAKDLADLDEPDVRLVCHSYGGLLARAAIHFGAANVTRVVTLGTPHEGAFSSVMVMRGTHPITQRIAAVDHRADPDLLSSRVFRTFPSSYHLLPRAALGGPSDAFDMAAWPESGVRPLPHLLQEAGSDRWCLAPIDDRFRCLAGYGYDTPLSAEATDDQFEYRLGTGGDSVVPLPSAAPPGSHAYYLEGGHGTLPNVPAVLEALPSLLETGTTTSLPREPPETEEREGTTDDEMGAYFDVLVESLKKPSLVSIRHLLTEYAAPPEPDQFPAPAATTSQPK